MAQSSIIAHRFEKLHFFANAQQLAQVGPLDEFHDDEILAGGRLGIDRQDFDDVGVVEGHADASLTHEQVDPLRILGPVMTQDLDGHHPPGESVLRPEDPSEAPRGYFVKEIVAAEHKSLPVAFAEFADLPRRQVSLAHQNHEQKLGRSTLASQFCPGVLELRLGNQSDLEELLSGCVCIELCHGIPICPGITDMIRLLAEYLYSTRTRRPAKAAIRKQRSAVRSP